MEAKTERLLKSGRLAPGVRLNSSLKRSGVLEFLKREQCLSLKGVSH